MRHIYVNRASYIIAALLLAGVLFIAWVRSQGVILNVLEEARTNLETTESFAWEGLGQNVFIGECSSCHTRLENVSSLFLAEGGRSYLVNFMLYGFEGEVTSNGEQRTLSHRPFEELDDESIAAVLNYTLISWGNDRTLPDEVDFYEPEEVASSRVNNLSQQDVAERRPVQ
jgi:mono/diheme cytochrome c family protein